MARLYNDQALELDRMSDVRAHSTANSAPSTTTLAAAYTTISSAIAAPSEP